MTMIDSSDPNQRDNPAGPTYRVTQRGTVKVTWRSTGIQHGQHRSEPVDVPDVSMSWKAQRDRDFEAARQRLHADRPEGVVFGRCWCGCNGETPISTYSHMARGRIKGEPIRYIAGHQTRKTNTASYRNRTEATT